MAQNYYESDNLIELTESKTCITSDSTQYYKVVSGEAYVYIQLLENDVLDRSLYLKTVKEGESIPSLNYTLANTQNSWRFMIKPVNRCVLNKEFSDDNNAKLGAEFADSVDNMSDAVGVGYEKRFVKWYIDELKSESDRISRIKEQKEMAREDNFLLIESLFKNEKVFKHNSNTESDLYNTVDVLCEYLNIPIASYQNLYTLYGDEFTLQDIARMSRFAIRKVTLTKEWYKRESGAFIGFYEDGGQPVILVPKNSTTYVMYDVNEKTEKVVEEEEARLLSSEGYIIYRHFSGESLTIRDVYSYGMKFVKTQDIVVYVLMFVLSTLIGLLLPFLNEKMFDELIPLGERRPIMQVGIVILACMIGNMFFGIVQNLSSVRGIKAMEYSIVSATFDRIFRLSQRFIERFGTIELVNRVTSVMGMFSQTVTAGVTAILGFVLSMFYLYRMFDESKSLAWRGLFMALISGVVMFVFGYLRVSKEREKLVASTKANGLLYQFMSGILKIKVSGLENRSLYEFQKANVESMRYDMRSTKISNNGGVFSAIMTVAYSGIIYYTVVKKGQTLTIGEYSAFSSAYGMFTSAVGQLVSFFITVASLIPVMERVKPIFEEPCEVKEIPKVIKKITGDIEVSHLSFSYENDENYVLKDISLKINKGEFIGIVGPSGCGKSTLLKLLMGFEDPTKGNIFFDDRDITTLEKTELRRQMGVVLQDGKMVVGNIYSNVTLSNPNMEPSEVEELLEVVGMGDDVARMPMGIFTSVSEGGGTLSGGQQQRVLIARAMANNPQILLFDEATSALDNVTQQTVCENITRSDMTRIMVAHRLSTVMNCDRIYVMDDGKLIEEGDYNSLMEKKGLFYKLVKRQEVYDDL